MAKFYPTREEITHLKRAPEPGELKLLDILGKLPDSYEVFFQPFMNGDRPDIVVINKGSGILVIEVKDWNLDYYFLDERADWHLKKDHSKIRSPIKQVYRYKENIFNLHIAQYLEKSIFDPKFWKIVKCAVYFAEANEASLKHVTEKLYSVPKRKGFILSNIVIWDKEVYPRKIQSAFESLRKSSMGRFGDEEYNEIIRYLLPSQFDYEQFFDNKEITYTTQQQRLVVSEPRDQWIKGVVGSGKTTVLAGRAVAAQKRAQGQVLILTYNITLKNYIQDKIARIGGRFDPNSYYIENYDQFIKTQMNNYGLEYNAPREFTSKKEMSEFFSRFHDDEYLFESVKDEIVKYQVILIDEVQDFKKVWLDIVKKYFLEAGGEYVLFSDEKQNIYDRRLHNKDITTNVAQRPSMLKESIRSTAKLRECFVDFQKQFMINKYEIDERDQFLNRQIALDFGTERLIHHVIPGGNLILLFNRFDSLVKTLGVHPKEVAVIAESVEFIRDFDLYYRVKTNEKTNCMVESLEVYFRAVILALDDFSFNDTEMHGSWQGKIKNGYQMLPKHKRFEDSTKQLCSLLAHIRVNEQVNQDKLFRANAVRNEPLLENVLVQNWAKDMLSSLDSLLESKEDGERFVQHMHWRLDKYRKGMKMHFWFHKDGVKMSTIHSYKGWEAGTLFMVIEPSFAMGNSSVHELIYTSITRSKNNLVILNLGNKAFQNEFGSFFSGHMF